MQITINLCTTPYRDVEPILRKLRMALAALGFLTLVAGGLLIFAHSRKTAFVTEERQLDATFVRQSAELEGYRSLLEKTEDVKIADRAFALNSLFEEKSFSWTLILKNFEDLVPPDVQLATIEPQRTKDGPILVRMHVVGPRDKLIQLIHGMETSNAFILPHVTAETAHSDARAIQHAVPLTASSLEEIDIEAGCAEVEPPIPETDGSAASKTETASAASPARTSGTPVAQVAAVPAPARPIRAGGTR